MNMFQIDFFVEQTPCTSNSSLKLLCELGGVYNILNVLNYIKHYCHSKLHDEFQSIISIVNSDIPINQSLYTRFNHIFNLYDELGS